MNYEQFLEQMKEDLQARFAEDLPPELADVRIGIRDVEKLQGESYRGISFRSGDSPVEANLNMTGAFQAYEAGRPYEDILEEVEAQLMKVVDHTPQFNIGELTDYEAMKPKLMMEVIGDLDMENRIIDINHQLQRTSQMKYVIQKTKTNAGTRKISMTDEVFYCFQAILEDRPEPKVEKIVDGYSGFLFLDKDGMPLVAMHWEHRFTHMVKRYNDIYRVQMPKITPHVCRHTYCSNQARAGMNTKTLQYLMGHSDIGVTMNTCTHLGLEDAAEEMHRLEEMQKTRDEMDKLSGKERKVKQSQLRVV